MSILFYVRDQKASQTAQYMAFFRALETQRRSASRLFNDPYAFPLLSGRLRAVARLAQLPGLGSLVRGFLDLGWPYTRSSGVVRTRAIDDLVRDAIRGGARQFVVLGAGFDSRALRLEEAGRIAVFEVDHPATQELKKGRLSAFLGRAPANIRYLAVDFERDPLEPKLIDSGFEPAAPAVVVWEGVVSYLTEPAVQGTLAALARLLAPSSSLIFTYMHEGALDGSATFPGARRWRSWVSFSGEPFIFGFRPETLAATLELFGFMLQKDESTHDESMRYCPPIGRSERGSEAYRVASAVRMEA